MESVLGPAAHAVQPSRRGQLIIMTERGIVKRQGRNMQLPLWKATVRNRTLLLSRSATLRVLSHLCRLGGPKISTDQYFTLERASCTSATLKERVCWDSYNEKSIRESMRQPHFSVVIINASRVKCTSGCRGTKALIYVGIKWGIDFVLLYTQGRNSAWRAQSKSNWSQWKDSHRLRMELD